MTTSEHMAAVLLRLGEMPWVGTWLRRLPRFYPEGSVVTIRTGVAAGIRWRRHHRFVNGYWIGSYELGLQRCVAEFLRPGAVFYDVGAHAGFFSMIGARVVGARGAVYAFEPVAGHRIAIEEQVALNGFGQCVVVPAAAGRESGTSVLSYSESSNSMGHLGPRRASDAGFVEAAVQVVALDDFAAGHRPPDVIKIDVEGAAHTVLAGARRVLGQHRPALLLELHDPEEVAGVHEVLRAAGYGLEDLDGASTSRLGPRHALARHPRRVAAPAVHDPLT